MTTLASTWLRKGTGELLLSPGGELQLPYFCSECLQTVSAVPRLIWLRQGQYWEAAMTCPVHGLQFPFIWLPPLPASFQSYRIRVKYAATVSARGRSKQRTAYFVVLARSGQEASKRAQQQLQVPNRLGTARYLFEWERQ